MSAQERAPPFPLLQHVIFIKQFLMKAVPIVQAFDFLISVHHNTNKSKSLRISNHNCNSNNINNFKRHTKNIHGNSIKNCAWGLVTHFTSM